MRDKFEAWAKDYVKNRDSNDNYMSPYTQAAWTAWQAALKTVSADGIQLILVENAEPKPDNIPYLAVKIAEAVEAITYF